MWLSLSDEHRAQSNEKCREIESKSHHFFRNPRVCSWETPCSSWRWKRGKSEFFDGLGITSFPTSSLSNLIEGSCWPSILRTIFPILGLTLLPSFGRTFGGISLIPRPLEIPLFPVFPFPLLLCSSLDGLTIKPGLTHSGLSLTRVDTMLGLIYLLFFILFLFLFLITLAFPTLVKQVITLVYIFWSFLAFFSLILTFLSFVVFYCIFFYWDIVFFVLVYLHGRLTWQYFQMYYFEFQPRNIGSYIQFIWWTSMLGSNLRHVKHQVKTSKGVKHMNCLNLSGQTNWIKIIFHIAKFSTT